MASLGASGGLYLYNRIESSINTTMVGWVIAYLYNRIESLEHGEARYCREVDGISTIELKVAFAILLLSAASTVSLQ